MSLVPVQQQSNCLFPSTNDCWATPQAFCTVDRLHDRFQGPSPSPIFNFRVVPQGLRVLLQLESLDAVEQVKFDIDVTILDDTLQSLYTHIIYLQLKLEKIKTEQATTNMHNLPCIWQCGIDIGNAPKSPPHRSQVRHLPQALKTKTAHPKGAKMERLGPVLHGSSVAARDEKHSLLKN